MIGLLIFLQLLPPYEEILYETNDKGKIGRLEAVVKKDSLGYHLRYRSDRIIEAIIDSNNLQTLYVNKIVKGEWELTVKREGVGFEVNYKGRKRYYREKKPIYDRHTLDFVLRGFKYHKDFKERIRLNVPEFMVINADLEVIGEERVISPVGEFMCWKIQMAPRVIFTRMRFYFWIEKEYPHRFVKYGDSSGKHQILLIKYSSERPPEISR